jgi:hypothetical protein
MPLYDGFSPTHGQTLGTVTIAGYTFPLEILKLDWDGLKRDAIDVTSMAVQPTTGSGLGNKMFIPSAYVDPGELSLNVLHNPLYNIPITDPSKAGPTLITFTLGPATSVQETFQALGFLTEYKIVGPLDGTAMTADIKIKLTDDVSNTFDAAGAVTFQAAS